jgi:hypothetical protein
VASKLRITTTKKSFNSAYLKSAIKTQIVAFIIALLGNTLLKPSTNETYNSAF